MNLNNITLSDFRNYRLLQLDFEPGVNLIVGNNAQGKTNLLEAIIYMGSGKSFRTQKSAELVRLGADFGEIEGNVYSQEREQTLRWILFSASRPRQLFQNGVKKKTAGDISGVLQTVLFCPEDLMVLKAGASARRRLGDNALCQLRPNYEAALTEYGRILEQKNRILKDRFENPALLEILPDYNTRLCQVGALLISYRARFYEGLGKAAAKYHGHFSGGAEEFSLQYRTVSTVTDPFAPVPVLTEQLQEHLQSHYRAELESAQCLTEDFLSAELSAVPAGRARDLGLDRSLIAGYGHDDRCCAYPALTALIDCEDDRHTLFCVLADKEETGSDGVSGMQSRIFLDLMDSIAAAMGGNSAQVRAASKCLSADVSAAYDPNFPEAFEKRNCSELNCGAVLSKYTGSRGKSGTSDASAEFLGWLRAAMGAYDVVWQTGELGKVDFGGGGTVAKFIANLNIDTVDLGVPVISMHAPYEVIAKSDLYEAYRAFDAFSRF